MESYIIHLYCVAIHLTLSWSIVLLMSHFTKHKYFPHAVAIVSYITFMYCKHTRNKRGSYDVQRRNRAHDVESATSSARSSFRAVSEYNYSPNLESRFNQLLPGSITSVSDESTTSSAVPEQAAESIRSSASTESATASSSSAAESSTESESQPLRRDNSKH